MARLKINLEPFKAFILQSYQLKHIYKTIVSSLEDDYDCSVSVAILKRALDAWGA